MALAAGAPHTVIRVAHPFRGEGFPNRGNHATTRKTLRPEGLSYKFKKTPSAFAEGVLQKTCELCYAVNWPRRINCTHTASIPQMSSASVPGSGVCTMNSCTCPVSISGPQFVTISKLLGSIVP